MQHNRVLILRGHPHTIARAVLLKVTFVQAPQLNLGAPGQTAEFFWPQQFSADPPERLGGVVCGAESPSSGIAFDIVAPPSARGSGDADAPTIPGHPTVWRGCRSPGGSSADRLAVCAPDRHLSTIIRNRRFLNLCRDAAFKLRTPQDEGLASSLAARNGAEVVRGLGDNTPRRRRQRRQTRPDIGRVDP